jgi:hypothetical protein
MTAHSEVGPATLPPTLNFRIADHPEGIAKQFLERCFALSTPEFWWEGLLSSATGKRWVTYCE